MVSIARAPLQTSEDSTLHRGFERLPERFDRLPFLQSPDPTPLGKGGWCACAAAGPASSMANSSDAVLPVAGGFSTRCNLQNIAKDSGDAQHGRPVLARWAMDPPRPS
jgi:hypothetical protein